MTQDDVKLIMIYSLTLAAWFTAGYLAGYFNRCEEDYVIGKEQGRREGIAEAVTPSND